MSILLFEDSLVDRLHPITLCRPSFAIRCGGYCLAEIIQRLGVPTAGDTRRHLNAFQQANWPGLALRDSEPHHLLLNARLVPDIALVPILQQILARQNAGTLWIGDQLAIAALPDSMPLPSSVAAAEVPSFVRESGLPEFNLSPAATESISLFDYPHSVVAKHRSIFARNLNDRIAAGEYQEISPGVYCKGDVAFGQHVVSDTSEGPIVLESGCSVGAFSFLAGPLLAGVNCRLKPRATILSHVSIGETAKVGGEVESSIIESFTNKQHHGYLGHAYLGSWVNIGAGTSNSNLKNTYGQVNMTVNGQRVATGMRLMGCIVGDHSKTAINATILTGRMIGVGSAVYGLVAKDVPSFVNYADQFGDVSSVSLDAAITTQKRMFARRNVTQRPCDAELLSAAFELTSADRDGLECRPPKLAWNPALDA